MAFSSAKRALLLYLENLVDALNTEEVVAGEFAGLNHYQETDVAVVLMAK